MSVRVRDADVEALRACMPELLRVRCGVENLSRSFSCPAPDHEDRDPSAHYYADRQVVHCFGCERTWDVFDLVGMLDGIEGFADRVQAVADCVGYRLELEDDDEAGRRERRERTRRARARAEARKRQQAKPPFEEPRAAGGADCSEMCVRAWRQLYTARGDVGRSWLRSRGLGDDDICRYGLGFCLRPDAVMAEFRWCEPGAAGFVTISFWDEGFSGCSYVMARTVPGIGADGVPAKVNNKEWRPKGLVSPLWREWLLTNAEDVVYLTEGLIDAMVLEKRVRRPTVALGGVSYAGRLASVLWHAPKGSRPKRVVVCMDEDGEGRKAAAKIAHDLDVIGIAHADLPPYPDGAKDADEWLMRDRGVKWEFVMEPVEKEGVSALARTRWLDG